jgi:hypothetical protein
MCIDVRNVSCTARRDYRPHDAIHTPARSRGQIRGTSAVRLLRWGNGGQKGCRCHFPCLFLERQFAEVVHLADLDTVVAQDGVGGGDMEIQVRNRVLDEKLVAR